MKSFLRVLAMGLLLAAPASAQALTVSPISDLSLNGATTRTINVVAYGSGTITLTASLPSFATLNPPTSGTGLVTTTITLAPSSGTTGTFDGSVTATSGASSTTEAFVVTVNAPGSNQAPVVTAPANENATAESMLSFTVSATDSEAITSLSASSLPGGATFTPNGTNTTGTFSWTPTSGQTGDFDVVFTASNTQSGSATTHIHVAAAANRAPMLTAPSTRTVTEGQTVSFTVAATDSDGDHVSLTATNVPSGAAATDNGDNTMTFSWTPATGQAGTYTVTFHGDDGHGGTASASTTITVLQSGGGGGGGTGATITLIGQVNTHNDRTCFRITPNNGAFDVNDVNLSTFTLQFDGHTLNAVSTTLQTDCDNEGGGDCGGDHEDAGRTLLGHGHGDNEGDHGGGCDCGSGCCGSGCTCGCGGCNPDTCAATAVKACFSTHQLLALFCSSLQDSLGFATISFQLNDGTVIVASFTGSAVVFHGKGHHSMDVMARPNPLNPRTTLTFTLARGGPVQITVYDAQGRLVKRLLDQNLAAGNQSLDWDGSNARNGRVSSGVYFFRIQAPEGQVVQRVAVVK